MKKFRELQDKVASLTADAVKAAAGNKSAGTRLRAGMQEVKELAQAVRQEVLAAAAAAPKGGA